MGINEKIETMMRHMNSIVNYISETPPYFYTDRLEGFNQVYPTTNEHLYAMFKSVNVKNKDVLTVGSSGDQILYSILFGAKNITCFDVNPFVKYFFDYKVATIKTYNYEQFREIFHFNIFREENKNWQRDLLSASVYKKISHLLPEDTKFFWDNIFLENNSVRSIFAERPEFLIETYIWDKKIYLKLQKALNANNYSVNFIRSDITKVFDKLGTDKKYDVILLSNIFDYLGHYSDTDIIKARKFYRLVKKFEQLLNPNGKIQLDYLYYKDHQNSKTLIAEFKRLFGYNSISSITSNYDEEATVMYSPSKNKDLQK